MYILCTTDFHSSNNNIPSSRVLFTLENSFPSTSITSIAFSLAHLIFIYMYTHLTLRYKSCFGNTPRIICSWVQFIKNESILIRRKMRVSYNCQYLIWHFPFRIQSFPGRTHRDHTHALKRHTFDATHSAFCSTLENDHHFNLMENLDIGEHPASALRCNDRQRRHARQIYIK